MKKANLAGIVLASAIGMAGCGGESPTAPACTQVDLQPQVVYMRLGETVSFKATGGDGKYSFGMSPSGFGTQIQEGNIFKFTLENNNVGYSDRPFASVIVDSCYGHPDANRFGRAYSQVYRKR